MGGFASHSMRTRYELFKQRTKELVLGGALLAFIVALLVWFTYHHGDG